MYRAVVTEVPPGSILGASVFNKDGRMLAQAGSRLNRGHLHQIANHGYRRIIVAERSADLPEFLRPSVRSNLLSTLRTAIDFLHDAWDADPHALPRPWGPDLALRRAVGEFVDSATATPRFPAPGPVRRGVNQWYDDAIAAASVAIALGSAFDLDDATMRRLAHGMLLRDVGMLALPADLLDGDDPLTPADRLRMHEHPVRAYHLLRGLDWGDETARLVVRQHHERHDGSGYPDGLSGLHSLTRTRRELLDDNLMLLVSDIAAVADVFAALLVDRPHRPPRRIAVVQQMLEAMAGHTLNAAVVQVLRERWRPIRELVLAA